MQLITVGNQLKKPAFVAMHVSEMLLPHVHCQYAA